MTRYQKKKYKSVRDTIVFEGDLKGTYEVKKTLKDELVCVDELDNVASALGFNKEIRISGTRQLVSIEWYVTRLGKEQIKKSTLRKLLYRSNTLDTTLEDGETNI